MIDRSDRAAPRATEPGDDQDRPAPPARPRARRMAPGVGPDQPGGDRPGAAPRAPEGASRTARPGRDPEFGQRFRAEHRRELTRRDQLRFERFRAHMHRHRAFMRELRREWLAERGFRHHRPGFDADQRPGARPRGLEPLSAPEPGRPEPGARRAVPERAPWWAQPPARSRGPAGRPA